ncbi:MAG TPA: GNAT family N-acetyltransferase [Acidimicrobiales bacterium]|jgi:ribosomal protein S18 acetylase RimI-like enzyme|nr:GNAT family N-acetyltransferase [Acidimicrobiales bacterium]
MVTEGARPGTTADVARLAELVAASRGELAPARGGEMWVSRDAPAPPHDQRLRDALDDATGAGVWCGTLDDVIVGLAVARIEVGRDGVALAVIDELYVEPGARGMGVGEAMMDLLVAWAGSAGCAGIDAAVLPGNRIGKNFFERYGLTARAIRVHRALPDSSDDDEQATP